MKEREREREIKIERESERERENQITTIAKFVKYFEAHKFH